MTISIDCPAKINWFLLVLGKREDGYHEIQSLMQCIGLYDTLTFEPSDEIDLVCDAPIPKEQNLVYRAAVLLKKHTGTRKGARITLVKRIPSPAGLGGGSSDAAHTLTGLSKLWGIELARAEFHALAAQLGSDVPFFLDASTCPTALVQGRGEIVTPMGKGIKCALAMFKPPEGIPTGWAYSNVRSYSHDHHEPEEIAAAIAGGNIRGIRRMLKNDLIPPALERMPTISALIDSLHTHGALYSSMSGSGPTVFGVFDTIQRAEEAVEDVLLDTGLEGLLWHAVAETL